MPESNIKYAPQKRVIIPGSYRTLHLDTSSLLNFLQSVPLQKDIADRSKVPVFDIPLPDGRIGAFHIWESSVMEPELAAKFPHIKTYSGQGIDDPTAILTIDWTELGFHAMILSPVSGSIFIDPFAQGMKTDYISYYKKDFKSMESYIELPPIKPPVNANSAGTTSSLLAQCTGDQLRTYRLAVACTHEYAIAATGFAIPTIAETLSAITTTVNRVDAVFQSELDIHMVLVANETDIIFPTDALDQFSNSANNNPVTLLNQSQSVIDGNIGDANYDMGHSFSTGAGGVSYLGVICQTGYKARSVTGRPTPIGDPFDIDYVAHEMGHSLGGNHTFNCTSGSCNGNGESATNTEPGSGSTIMAYAGICSPENLQPHSDAQFHAVNFDEIATYTINDAGNGCSVKTNTGNIAPVVNAGSNYIIPVSTPFILTGSATDANISPADVLTYSWEQMDAGGPFGAWDAPSGNAPIFRTFAPQTTGMRYFPQLSDVINGVTTIGEILPTYTRTLHFRLTVRDNRAGGGGICYDENAITVSAASGPFTVTYPSATGISWYVNELKTITWNPAGTAGSPINSANVSIQLSTDGGNTYPIVLSPSTANDGTEQIQVPDEITNTARIRIMAVGNIFYDISNSDFVIQATPATYTFIGNGNWDEPNNWLNNSVPPATLPANSSIIINNVEGGECVLNIIQYLSAGSTVTVLSGKRLMISGMQ